MMAGTTRSASPVLACAQLHHQHFADSPTAETGLECRAQRRECVCFMTAFLLIGSSNTCPLKGTDRGMVLMGGRYWFKPIRDKVLFEQCLVLQTAIADCTVSNASVKVAT